MPRFPLYFNVANDLSNCTFDENNHLIDIPSTEPLYVGELLRDALRRAPQEDTTPYCDLDHFAQIKSLISEYVKRNNSIAIVHPDNTITIKKDDGSDPDFAEKALAEARIRPNVLEDGCAFHDPTEFAAWATEATWCGDGLDESGTNKRNYAAEYLIRNKAWTPLSGPVLFAHADHGVPQEDEDEKDDDDDEEDPQKEEVHWAADKGFLRSSGMDARGVAAPPSVPMPSRLPSAAVPPPVERQDARVLTNVEIRDLEQEHPSKRACYAHGQMSPAYSPTDPAVPGPHDTSPRVMD